MKIYFYLNKKAVREILHCLLYYYYLHFCCCCFFAIFRENSLSKPKPLTNNELSKMSSFSIYEVLSE